MEGEASDVRRCGFCLLFAPNRDSCWSDEYDISRHRALLVPDLQCAPWCAVHRLRKRGGITSMDEGGSKAGDAAGGRQGRLVTWMPVAG